MCPLLTRDAATIHYRIQHHLRELKAEKSVFTLNLGQWTGSPNVPIDDQRRVVVLRVIRRDKVLAFQASLLEAIKAAQSEQPIYRDLLNNYSMSSNPVLL